MCKRRQCPIKVGWDGIEAGRKCVLALDLTPRYSFFSPPLLPSPPSSIWVAYEAITGRHAGSVSCKREQSKEASDRTPNRVRNRLWKGGGRKGTSHQDQTWEEAEEKEGGGELSTMSQCGRKRKIRNSLTNTGRNWKKDGWVRLDGMRSYYNSVRVVCMYKKRP